MSLYWVILSYKVRRFLLHKWGLSTKLSQTKLSILYWIWHERQACREEPPPWRMQWRSYVRKSKMGPSRSENQKNFSKGDCKELQSAHSDPFSINLPPAWMSGPQCFENPPSIPSAGAGAGRVEELAGFKTYITGPPDSELAILFICDAFGESGGLPAIYVSSSPFATLSSFPRVDPSSLAFLWCFLQVTNRQTWGMMVMWFVQGKESTIVQFLCHSESLYSFHIIYPVLKEYMQTVVELPEPTISGAN